MEALREKLNGMLEDDNISLCSKDVVMVSQELDKLIYGYYKEMNKN